MSRLIDADAIQYRTIRELLPDSYVTNTDIDEMPTVDAVPVVRCKDCIYWLKTTITYEEGDPVYTCPKLTMEWGDEDGYCFMGERR